MTERQRAYKLLYGWLSKSIRDDDSTLTERTWRLRFAVLGRLWSDMSAAEREPFLAPGCLECEAPKSPPDEAEQAERWRNDEGTRIKYAGARERLPKDGGRRKVKGFDQEADAE